MVWDPENKWPKKNGSYWGYFTPASGVLSPYLHLFFGPTLLPCLSHVLPKTRDLKELKGGNSPIPRNKNCRGFDSS